MRKPRPGSRFYAVPVEAHGPWSTNVRYQYTPSRDRKRIIAILLAEEEE